MSIARRSRVWSSWCLVLAGCAAGAERLVPPTAPAAVTPTETVGVAKTREPTPPPPRITPRPDSASHTTTAPSTDAARQLLAAYPAPAGGGLGYVPSEAQHFQCLQDSPFKLDAEERAILDAQGLVLSPQNRTFAMFYMDAFHADLPVFISADAILHAWHRAYDELLIHSEQNLFAPLLEDMLKRMRQNLATTPAKPETKAALDEYLTVAHSLLQDKQLAPSAGGSAERVTRNYEAARGAQGNRVELFGSERSTDLSQFKPRGHYEKTPQLIPYFRAMVWLGRMDFRLFQTQPDGKQLFQRADFEAMVLARQVMDPTTLARWSALDQSISLFVGMHDNATPRDVDALLQRLKVSSFHDLRQRTDLVLQDAVASSDFGKQRILSDWQGKNPDAPPLPNNTSFALFGQRYTLDGHALHSVVQDRVPNRLLPSALDVGFSVFRSNSALQLLGSELDKPTLPAALNDLRALSDGQDEAYWGSSFYTLWLAALRGMSPAETDKLPKSARTDAWARRTLAAQLASWSELRHDTVLYAKQSYSAFILCQFPDAYVDPYPEVFKRLVQSSDLGLSVVRRMQALGLTKTASMRDYFEGAKKTFNQLEQIATRELAHQRLTTQQLAFINQMIVAKKPEHSGGCGGARLEYSGWYKQLFYTADIFDPDVTIADVHTSPDLGVLHIAKRTPRKAIISIDDGSGARIFTGATYSVYQVVDGGRLSDEEWSERQPKDEPWLLPILAHANK